MNAKAALLVLLGVIPAVYFVVALVLAATTEVFSPESRLKFATFYGLLAVVLGSWDAYRLWFEQGTPVWLAPRTFVRRVVRGHLLTLVLILLSVQASLLFDIDNGWPILAGFMCGPVAGRWAASVIEQLNSKEGISFGNGGRLDMAGAVVLVSLIVLYCALKLGGV